MGDIHLIHKTLQIPVCRDDERVMTDDIKLVTCPVCLSLAQSAGKQKQRFITSARD